MELDVARKFFDYNIAGGYVGEKTPVWCEDNMREVYNI
jgi:hypothetical protein